MHYYQHHIGDFIKATARLTDSQSMAYLRLLWMYYDSEKPLPNDVDVLSMQVGLPAEDVQLLLRAYFRLEDGVWKHTRCDTEIAEYREFVTKKSNAGRASAERRLNKRSTGVQQVLNNSSTVVQLTNNHKPITNNHKPKRDTATTVAPPDGVSESVWVDFVKHRKDKKAQVTQIVIDGLKKEAEKAGWPLEDVLKEMIIRNWQGFKAHWVQNKSPESSAPKGLAGAI